MSRKTVLLDDRQHWISENQNDMNIILDIIMCVAIKKLGGDTWKICGNDPLETLKIRC